MSAPPVSSVLSQLPSSSDVDRLSAVVRPSRAARGRYRHDCRQIICEQSVNLLSKAIAMVVRLVATLVRVPSYTHETPRWLRGIWPIDGAVGCGRWLP